MRVDETLAHNCLESHDALAKRHDIVVAMPHGLVLDLARPAAGIVRERSLGDRGAPNAANIGQTAQQRDSDGGATVERDLRKVAGNVEGVPDLMREQAIGRMTTLT